MYFSGVTNIWWFRWSQRVSNTQQWYNKGSENTNKGRVLLLTCLPSIVGRVRKILNSATPNVEAGGEAPSQNFEKDGESNFQIAISR